MFVLLLPCLTLEPLSLVAPGPLQLIPRILYELVSRVASRKQVIEDHNCKIQLKPSSSNGVFGRQVLPVFREGHSEESLQSCDVRWVYTLCLVAALNQGWFHTGVSSCKSCFVVGWVATLEELFCCLSGWGSLIWW